MARRKEQPLQWTWRIGALQCKHRVKSPVGRTIVCDLGEHLMRCARRTCEEVGEEKKVIAEGKDAGEPTKTDGQILADEINRRLASRRTNAGEEIDRLRAENANLRAENAKLRADFPSAPPLAEHGCECSACKDLRKKWKESWRRS
jgi:hypothetical protein